MYRPINYFLSIDLRFSALLTDSSRQAEDQSSLSLHALTLGDLIREAHHHAFQSGDKMVSDQHINMALDHRKYRLGYLRELYWQDLSRGTQLIETRGHRLGQLMHFRSFTMRMLSLAYHHV